MREIRFRAKTIKGGQWIEGDLFRAGTEPSDGEFAISYWDEDDGWMNENVRPDTIGEYVGLKDKNGTDIYEGDIMRIQTFDNLSFKSPIEEGKQMRELFTLEDLKGAQEAESVSAVQHEEGLFMVSLDWENDTYLSCLFGDMKKSNPIFEFEVIGNIHDNPDIEPKYDDRFKNR